MVNQLGQEEITWKQAAQLLGEELASVGPPGYYSMSPTVWLSWARLQLWKRSRDQK